MNEIWKDIYFEEKGIIYDFKNIYQVSNLGRVKSLINNHGDNREKVLKFGKSKNGYLLVNLCKNKKRKSFYVHRLVAHMFIENDDPANKTQVNHINEFEKDNNRIDNLEWCTHKYNQNYGTKNKRHSEKMKGIKPTKETREKLSKANSGKNNPNCGDLIERWKDGELIDIKYNYEYRKMGFTHVSDCCNGKRKQNKGYTFKYHK